MAKNIIDLDDRLLLEVKEIAKKNNLGTTNQVLVNISLRCFNDASRYMDDEDFKNIFGLKK